jgi:hypothetical protein
MPTTFNQIPPVLRAQPIYAGLFHTAAPPEILFNQIENEMFPIKVWRDKEILKLHHGKMTLEVQIADHDDNVEPFIEMFYKMIGDNA